MEKKHKTLPEKTYKADIMPDGATYKVPPMDMINEQIKRDSMKSSVIPVKEKNLDDFE